jgi:hypothetical protein
MDRHDSGMQTIPDELRDQHEEHKNDDLFPERPQQTYNANHSSFLFLPIQLHILTAALGLS